MIRPARRLPAWWYAMPPALAVAMYALFRMGDDGPLSPLKWPAFASLAFGSWWILCDGLDRLAAPRRIRDRLARLAEARRRRRHAAHEDGPRPAVRRGPGRAPDG